MKKVEKIKEILKEYKPELKEKYRVKEIGIFGSYVRGEAKKKSDIDILVSFDGSMGLFKFLDLEEYLHEITGTKVDLVMKTALKPRIGKHILSEVVYI